MELKEWLKDNELSMAIWEKKYRHNNESLDEWFDRVSGNDEEVKELIKDKKFLFGGRILSNRGVNKDGVKASLSNCYVLSVDDSIESIYECCARIARTYSYGGGCGIDISKLRPRGAKVSNSAKFTTGAVSFMPTFDTVTGTIGQQGRRGALMISMSVNHPDLEEFIDVKANDSSVTNANISVRMNDDFMIAVLNKSDYLLRYPIDLDVDSLNVNDYEYNVLTTIDEGRKEYVKRVNADELFTKLARNNWDYAEPGILYWSEIERYNMMSENSEFKYAGVNPCFTADMQLLTADGYKSFGELCGRTDVDVVSYDGQISKNNKVWCSGKKETIIIELSNGEQIKCTPNHVFLLCDGRECEAKDLLGELLEKPIYNDKSTYSELKYCRVESIRFNGFEDVYDFTENINHWGIVNGFVAHNCAEEPLPDGGACLLGSINLSEYVNDAKFDLDGLSKDVKTAVRGLNQVLVEGYDLHPLQTQRDCAKKYKQIGLGVMGLADAMIKMGYPYGGLRSLKLTEEIMQTIAGSSYEESCDLNTDGIVWEGLKDTDYYQFAIEPYIHHSYRTKYPLNSQILTCAPTGTLSTLLNISGGCEPIYALSYTRTTKSLHNKDVSYKVFPSIVQDYFNANSLENDESILPKYFHCTATELNPIDRLMMQSVLQSYIDASISSTLNLPNNTTVDEVKDIYIKAYEFGLKGVTIFRDGCKRSAILTTDADKKSELTTCIQYTKREKVLEADYSEVKVKGEVFSVIIGLLDGKPYEVFAYKKTDGKRIPDHKGKITKIKKQHYRFDSDLCKIDNLVTATEGIEERAATLYASMLLRHNASLEFILKTAKKVDANITSFSSAMCRVLSRYLGTIEVKGEVCPECGGKLIRTNGCVVCEGCGTSKCG